MLVPADIMGLNQELDFQTGQQKNFIVLRLATGAFLKLAADDAVAKAVVEAFVYQTEALERSGQAQPPHQQPSAVPQSSVWREEQVDGTTAHVFGGGDDEVPETPFAPASPPPMPLVSSAPSDSASIPVDRSEPPPELARANMHVMPNGRIIVPQKTLPMDKMGNPIVPSAPGSVDHLAVSQGEERDEDGISSI